MARSTKKRENIIRVASKIFYEKGFAAASIAEIAKSAEVRETLIYELFSGKEDLLFNIPIENTNVLIDNLLEHLSGVKGTENKLRKLIWHYLNFMENNRDYATLVLFELRPNRRFYQASAYGSFKRYNRIVMDILKEGVTEGVFYENLNLNLLRNLIFGALDHIIYSWLIFNRPDKLVELSDELFEILFGTTRTLRLDDTSAAMQNQAPAWSLDKRIAILRAAEAIFAEKGFDKARISDIAKALNIGEATLYEYFKNKEDILFSIPDDRTKNLLTSLADDLEQNHAAESGLRVFIRHYLAFLEANRDYTAILLFELRSSRRFYSSPPYAIVKQYNDILMGILKKGQADQTFSRDANIHLIRHMIFGSIDHTALTWLLFNKPSSLLGVADSLAWFVLNTLRR
ncbi:hypothetical protein DSCO28_47410 [Desulfosarcina ovata subsp. sediminis]|uniref:HTH tetR-type domain-containing protein n=1 Tax=Desulfosarcina ovata subsp. sediminis TaxID=885957 RepID=A0A5K7ZV98_9BACT|nr:TetR/AcrR family transcriptional regulator [Desulfosarcina ovata]BBO84175.1 hypothetical protein DSCO28_47410 [Desulfosarcina ovata subsp. sediminis]